MEGGTGSGENGGAALGCACGRRVLQAEDEVVSICTSSRSQSLLDNLK